MNWLTDFVRPKIKKIMRRDTPESLWCQCPGCQQMRFIKDLENNMWVCKDCAYHFHYAPEERLKNLFDGGAFKTLQTPCPPDDPLGFKDTKPYGERLKDARKMRKHPVLVGEGAIQRCLTTVAAMDFKFIGGSMGRDVGSALVFAALHAIKSSTPLIIISSSGGARMQEGVFSLMQMPRTIVALRRLREKRLPFISVLTYPTTGGVSASFASLGDINLAEPGGTIGFAGARVIQQNLKSKIPEGFQSAEFQLSHGAIDQIVHRHALKNTLGTLLNLLNPNIVQKNSS